MTSLFVLPDHVATMVMAYSYGNKLFPGEYSSVQPLRAKGCRRIGLMPMGIL